jgi:hypothetical protein
MAFKHLLVHSILEDEKFFSDLSPEKSICITNIMNARR